MADHALALTNHERTRELTLRGALFVLAGSALAGCGGSGNHSLPSAQAPLSRRSRLAATTQFVGYWDGWQKNNLVDTPSAVTEIPVAFGFLRGHQITLGGINSGYVTAVDIVSLHAEGIKVTLSLGGWSPKNSFVFDGDVQGFDQSLASILAMLPFDGVDFDMEHGSMADRVTALTTLIPAVRAYFNSI